ncbi:MAG TPA: ABC transporter permease [Candidatus Limnocylindrales bacterium]|nr:ABC transporter permease [Candidatus Limnocylindrales bacterium]
MSRPAPLPASVAALAGWELRVTARRGENLLVTLFIPVAILVFFSAVPVIDLGTEEPVTLLLPGAISLAVIATGLVSLAIATGYERGYGVLKRLGGSPLPRSGVITAKALAVAVTVIAQAVLLVAVAVGLGWRPGPGTSAPIVIAALVLGALTFSALGLAMAGRLRPEATMATANGLFLACLLIGGIIVPLDRLPAAVPILAQLLPPAALTEALRAGLEGGNAVQPLVVLTAWAVGAIAVTARTFRWE